MPYDVESDDDNRAVMPTALARGEPVRAWYAERDRLVVYVLREAFGSVAQAGRALGLGAGAIVTTQLHVRGGFAVVGVGLLAVGTAYTLHLPRSGTLLPDHSA